MKKKAIICIIVFIVVVIGVFSLILIKPNKRDNSKEIKEINEKLKEVAGIFYKSFYYNAIGGEKVVSNFEDTGITISVSSVSAYKDETEIKTIFDQNLIDLLNKNKCDFDKTTMIIMPISPFANKDYKVSINLNCQE